jgi:hypothetical protein
MNHPPFTWRLRDLPFVARLVIALFLCSVGCGFLAALVQVHVQDASPGEEMPSQQRLIDKFHGKDGVSTIEQLITADESLPFGVSGTMQPAFTTRSGGWAEKAEERARQKADKDKVDFDALDEKDQNRRIAEAKTELRKERTGEMKVMAHWIRHGLDKTAYDKDFYRLPEELKDKPITEQFVTKDESGTPGVKVHQLVSSRCVKCHDDTRRAEADFAPLNQYWEIKAYADPQNGAGAMSLHKLAQTTHVHLFGFSMLYFLTGVLFAMTNYPGIIRFFIAPAALLAQFADVSCWWLARLDNPVGSLFAQTVSVTGGIVGLFLALQIVLTLFSLFGKFGKLVVVVLLVLAALTAWRLYEGPVKTHLGNELKASGAVEK